MDIFQRGATPNGSDVGTASVFCSSKSRRGKKAPENRSRRSLYRVTRIRPYRNLEIYVSHLANYFIISQTYTISDYI